MEVLFCHDGPLRKDEHNNYYGTAHNDETFRRYYTIANELRVAMRINAISKSEADEKLSRITVSNFSVHEIPNMSSTKGAILNRRQSKEIIGNAVKCADYIVVRLPSVIGFMAFDFAKKYEKPCLVEIVACPWDAFWNHSLMGKAVAPFMYYSTKRRVSKASHVVYVTNSFLQKRYPTTGNNVNCSNVSLKEFNESVLENRLNKIMEMQDKEKIIIGTTAAINVRYKGQQYVIEALGRLKKQGVTQFEYQLVGGGDVSYLKSVAEKFNVSDQVVFLGPLPHNKVFDWLESIDIYTQPSRQEGLPRALIEAMSCGLPAFGANTAGIPELLDNKYIFSNTKKNIGEICSILMSFSKGKMKTQAKRNYFESQKYSKDVIESRRVKFFKEFAETKYKIL